LVIALLTLIVMAVLLVLLPTSEMARPFIGHSAHGPRRCCDPAQLLNLYCYFSLYSGKGDRSSKKGRRTNLIT
jgi:hypothetical protein